MMPALSKPYHCVDFDGDFTRIPTYNPDGFMDLVKRVSGAKNDRQMALWLEIPATYISKIRHRRLSVTSSMMLIFHIRSGEEVSFNQMRESMGVPLYIPKEGRFNV